MKRTTFFAAFACALLILSLLGCGATNHLQSVTLAASGSKSAGGFYNLVGEGGTLQLVAIGNYTNGKGSVITSGVTFDVTVSPDYLVLPNTPPASVLTNATGLMTAVEPFECTWENVGTVDAPSWLLTGSYKVTATYKGVTSSPIYVGVGSAVQAGQKQCGP